MSELLSHPGVRLYDHLLSVGGRAASILHKLSTHLTLCIPPQELVRAAFITGITHDFGKAKRQFQDYIRGGKGEDKDHAAISSVFTFIVASDVFGQKPQPTRLLPFVCAYAVHRHHALLCNLEEAFEQAGLEHQIAIARDSMDARLWDFQFLCEPLDLTIRFSDYRQDFEQATADEKATAGQLTSCFQKFAAYLREKADGKAAAESWLVDLYFALLLIVSSLTEADIACAIDAPEPKPTSALDPERVRRYAWNQPRASETFQQLRERAWKEIQTAIEQRDLSALRLTLPTGLGKTLMGLYLSARLQEPCAGPQEPAEFRPIIYALPYLAIIEQATDVARQVFPKAESHVSVIQHHSLSFPDLPDEAFPNFERARFALEDWDADLVVTTFDQLFYSFLSRDRGFLRRFFRLPGAVLLLDEVQTIPPRLLPAVEVLLQQMREKLGVRLLYMTATHPPFLKEAKSLVPSHEDYFRPLARTRLHLRLEPTPFSEYLNQLGDWLLERRGKKVLLVANTIRGARELFAHLIRLKQEKPNFQELRLFHLSGSVVPVERLRRIKEIRRLIKSEPDAWLCVVATQCVEAGVDLDMDEAVRDFAPWDSLLQVCGRVNRFGKRPRADVCVYRWLDDENDQGREFHSYIYDSVFTAATLDVLSGRQTVEEEQYWEIQQNYARELEQRLSRGDSEALLQSALAWKFNELDFQELFRGQERAWKVSVFCVADETAEQLKQIAIELWSSKNPKGALELLCNFCDEELFSPLREFLRVEPELVKQYAQTLESDAERRGRYTLSRLLYPMLQAYTISMPVRRLNELSAGRISEGFPYLPPEVYHALDLQEGEVESRLPDWIL